MLFRNTNVNQSISSSILEKDFKTIQYFIYFIHNNCYCKLDKKAMTQEEFDRRQPTVWAYISERSRNSKELKKYGPLCFQLQKRLQNCKCPSVCQSVSLSVCLSQKPLSLSELCLSAKSQSISAYQPLCQSAIMPLSHHDPPLSLSES